MTDSEQKVSCALAFPQDCSDENVLSAVTIARPMMEQSSSLWLLVKGSYSDGSVSCAPHKVAAELKKQGWAIRNEIVWKCKAGDPAPDNRLKRSYETVFHLTTGKGYYYDRTIAGTVSSEQSFHNIGVGYAKKIAQSPFLSAEEKSNAQNALNAVLTKVNSGEVGDFRMAIRGLHRVDRCMAHKIDKFGFHIRASKKHSPMLGDVWDEWSSETNAHVPLGMIARMVRLTCPINNYVLDLFPSITTAKAIMACDCKYKSLFRLGSNPKVFDDGDLPEIPGSVLLDAEKEPMAKNAQFQ